MSFAIKWLETNCCMHYGNSHFLLPFNKNLNCFFSLTRVARLVTPFLPFFPPSLSLSLSLFLLSFPCQNTKIFLFWVWRRLFFCFALSSQLSYSAWLCCACAVYAAPGFVWLGSRLIRLTTFSQFVSLFLAFLLIRRLIRLFRPFQSFGYF